ncbi:MAG TPA: hypothetical protein VI248_01265, partial [Kineosporiaceae bacterium]
MWVVETHVVIRSFVGRVRHAAGRPAWDDIDDLGGFSGRGPAEHLWSRTELTAADVDSAHLYDGFSFIA